MSSNLSKRAVPAVISRTPKKLAVWWEERSKWQKVALGIGIAGGVMATGGALTYAIAGYGFAMTVATPSGTATVAAGKAAIGLVKRV